MLFYFYYNKAFQSKLNDILGKSFKINNKTVNYFKKLLNRRKINIKNYETLILS